MIAFILVEPENPDNIGAAARAMKNMGLEDLRLVKPPADWKSKGRKMAVNAADLLEKARAFESLEEALSDCHFVIGTTRRSGPKRGVFISFPEALHRLRKTSGKKQTAAVLFGKESKGLDNAALRRCNFLTALPAHSGYPSLNLAQAVMVTAFSLFSFEEKKGAAGSPPDLVPQKDIEDILEGIRLALRALDYKTGLQDRITATFHGLLKRGGLIESEAQMLRGLCRRICDRGRPPL